MKTMSEMSVGEDACVLRLELEGTIGQRLYELGICPGARLSCVGKSPMGDPRAYLVSGAVIALRQKDASHIFIS